MTKRYTLYIVFIFLTIQSCIEDYPIDFPATEPKLVVDAWLSSEFNESYINLGWTFGAGDNCMFTPGFIIRDDFSYGGCALEKVDSNYRVKGIVTLSEENGLKHEFLFKMQSKKGFLGIDLDTLKGFGGKKYLLDIEILYNNQLEHYHGETYMHLTPTIDSIYYEVRQNYLSEKVLQYMVPLIYFHEPVAEKNYYLFRVCGVRKQPNSTFTISCGGRENFPYSFADDHLFQEHVSSFPVDDGVGISKLSENYPQYYDGPNNGVSLQGVEVSMWSVTKETFEFYKALSNQFNNDGGAYQPSPATPPGNISNGAIGLFRATQHSKAMVFPE